MPSELFKKGTERIVYKAKKFATGQTITCELWDPDLVKSSSLTLTELERGLYYLDYNFSKEGTYIGLFYENGKESTIGIFRVEGTLPVLKSYLTRIIKIEQGRWVIKNFQLTLYDVNGTTPLVVFDLKDKEGKPTEEAPYERVPVYVANPPVIEAEDTGNAVLFSMMLEGKKFSKKVIKNILEVYTGTHEKKS